METAKRIIIMLTLVLFTTGTAISEETEISNTRTASCLVKITSDPAILPLEDTTIDYLLHSSGIGGKAAKEILEHPLSGNALEEALGIEWLADEVDMMQPGPLGDPPQGEERELSEYDYEMMMQEMGRGMTKYAPDSYGFQPESSRSRSRGRDTRTTTRLGRRTTGEPYNITSEQMILLRIAVNLQENDIGVAVKPAAEEFMNAVIENLREALLRAFNEHRNRLGGRLQLAEEEASRTERELREMQDKLRNIAGSRILDRGNILGEIMDMRRSLQSIKMDQGSDQVIVEAITQRIAETQAKLKDQTVKDDITKELQFIIRRQDENLINTKNLVQAGQAGTAALIEAEEKLTRAKIELAQRREQMSKSAGGDLIESLNRELADRSVQAAQNEAKIASLSRQLAEAEEWLNKSDDHELLTLKADITKQNLREALIWRDRISRQMRLIQPPAVSVLGGE